MKIDAQHATISIRDLELSTIIGCYRAEKDTPQPLFVDLDMITDISVVAQSDKIEDALDYVLVVDRIKALATSHGCELLEAFGQKIADSLSEFEAIQSFDLTLKKPAAIAECQSVCLRFVGYR